MKKIITLIMAFVLALIISSTKSEAAMQNTIESLTLKNGLKVIIKPVPTAPVVSVFVWYKVGARNEPAGQSGLAHFLEHMMFKGSKKFGKGEIARLVGRTGGQQNAFTSYDYTAYYETVPKSALNLALDIESDRMRHALLEVKEVASEKTVILSELDGNRNHPQVRLRELVNAHTWENHPYRRPVIGWKNEVAKLTAAQLKAFYDHFYQPNNATLVIVGDVTKNSVLKQIKQYFGPIPRGPQPPAMTFLEELDAQNVRLEMHDNGPAKMLRFNFKIPPATSDAHYALTLLNEALVTGHTSRLYKALVETGMASNVSANPLEMVDKGVWSFSVVATPPTSLEAIEKVLFSEFEKIKTSLLTKEEFQRVVNKTKAQFVYAKDSLTDQAMMLGFYETVAGDYERADTYPEKVAAVTRAQIQSAAQTYLTQATMTMGKFIPLTPTAGAGAVLPDAGVVEHYQRPLQNSLRDTGIPGASQGGQPQSHPAFIETALRKQLVLPNGLTIIMQVNPSNPMLVISGLVDAGMINEPADKPGLALLHSRMLTKGTSRQSADQLAEALEFKGADLTFQAQLEYLNIDGEALSDDLKLLMTSLADCLMAPVFPKQELSKAREKLLAQCRLAEDNANLQAWQGFYDLAYPAGHPMRRSILTAAAGLPGITRNDLLAYHRRMITPERTIISISGAFDPEVVKTLTRKLFSTWKRGSAQPTAEINMAKVTKTERHLTIMEGKHESMAVLGQEGLSRLDPDYYNLLVANQVLGGAGLSSQLMRVVRDQHGLSYGIYSYLKISKGQRPWVVVFQSDPKSVDQAIALTKEEVKQLQEAKLSKQQLQDSQSQLAGQLVIHLETNNGLAFLNREIAYYHLGWDYLTTYPKSVEAVTYKDMVQAAQRYLHPQEWLISVAGPALPGDSGK